MANLAIKEELSLKDKLKILDKFSDNWNKKAGKTLIGRIGNNPELLDRLKIDFIPTPSMEVNDVCGGGIPKRRITIIAGLEDSGKTSLLLETIGMNMKNDPNFCACWLESENSLEINYLINTFGIDPDRFFYMEHDRENAAEKILDALEAVVSTGAINIAVINSLKCLVPKDVIDKSFEDATVAIQARMNSKLMDKMTPLISENNTALVLVAHLSTDIGTMARDNLSISGGRRIRYSSSLTLDFRKRSILDSDPIKKEEGIKIGVTVKKNHCVPDRNPYLKTEYYVKFGEGIEQNLSVIKKAIESGALKQSGAYIREITSDGEIREEDGFKYDWRGKESLRAYLEANPAYRDYLVRKIKLSESLSDEEIEEILKQDELDKEFVESLEAEEENNEQNNE